MILLLSMPAKAEWIMIFIALIILITPMVFFLISLQNTLLVISPESRKTSPASVWLMLIPVFNIVWQFIMVDKIAQSIGVECSRLNISVADNKPTYSIGLAWNICNFLSLIPFIGVVAALVTFILYWVKVAEFKRIILSNQHNFMLDAERNIFYGQKPS